MKFTKGLILGSLITTGVLLMYTESDKLNKKTIMKKGRKIAKKMGVL